MVSDFAMAQCGQVMTDSKFMDLSKACCRRHRCEGRQRRRVDASGAPNRPLRPHRAARRFRRMGDGRSPPSTGPHAGGCGRYLRGGTGADDNEVVAVHHLPFATLVAIQAVSDHFDAQDQRRNQHVTNLGKPRGQPNRAAAATTTGVAQQIAATTAPTMPLAMRIPVTHGVQLFGSDG